jgi:MFS family permease
MNTPQTKRRYHGWNMVWVLAASTTVAYGVLYYAFAVFVKSMESEMNWSRAQTAGAISLSLVVAGLVAPWLGRVVDRHGTRPVMSLGAVAAAGLVLAWSRVSSLEMLYIIWAGLGITMACTFYDPAFTAVAVWFRAYRARALLVITLVAGLASTIFLPLSTLLLERLGWRDGIAVLAVIMLATALPLWLVLRRHPHDLGLEVDGETSITTTQTPHLEPVPMRIWLTSRTFWGLALGFALARMGSAVLAPHLVPLLRERGYSAAVAATAAGMIGVLQLGGRIVIAPLVQQFSLVWLTAGSFAVHGLGILLLSSVTDAGVWLFVALYGATNGAITIMRAALTAELFSTRIYGAVSGATSLVIALSSAFAPFMAGILHDRSGNYQTTLWLLVACLGCASLTILGAQTRRKIAPHTQQEAS